MTSSPPIPPTPLSSPTLSHPRQTVSASFLGTPSLYIPSTTAPSPDVTPLSYSNRDASSGTSSSSVAKYCTASELSVTSHSSRCSPNSPSTGENTPSDHALLSVTFDESVDSPAPSRLCRPPTPGTQLTRSLRNSYDSEDEGMSKFDESDMQDAKGILRALGGLQRARASVDSGYPMAGGTSSYLGTSSSTHDVSTEKAKEPTSPAAVQNTNRNFLKFFRYVIGQQEPEIAEDLESPGSLSAPTPRRSLLRDRPRAAGHSQGSLLRTTAFHFPSHPVFSNMMNHLRNSPEMKWLPLPTDKQLQLNDIASRHWQEIRPMETETKASSASGYPKDTPPSTGRQLKKVRTVHTGDSSPAGNKLGSLKSPVVRVSRIPRLIPQSPPRRHALAGFLSPTDYFQSPCTIALYGKRKRSLGQDDRLRSHLGPISLSSRWHTRIPRPQRRQDPPVKKKRNENQD